MIMFGGVQYIGSFSTMDGKAKKAEGQKIFQDMELCRETCYKKVKIYVFIGN